MGRLGDDPKKRVISSGASAGQEVVSFSVATNIRRGGQEETVWWNVTVWPDRAHLKGILKFLKKGSAVVVTGEIGKPRTYVGKDGQTYVAALDITADSIGFSPFGRPDGAPGTTASNGQEQQPNTQAFDGVGSGSSYGFTAPSTSSSMTSTFGQGSEVFEGQSDEIPF